jgi:hypothetical protein
MKTSGYIFVFIAIIILTTTVIADELGIGVFFDPEGTQDWGTFNGGLGVICTAYVCVVDVDMMVAGGSFKLDSDYPILLLSAAYADGVAIGEITEGVELGLATPIPAFSGDTALLATLQMTVFEPWGLHPLSIVAHPNSVTPIVADSQALLWSAVGLTGYLEFGDLPSESLTWGDVKKLFH